MLTDILIFAGVVALFFLGAELLGGGERRQMQKRIDRLKNRKIVAVKSPQDMKLRRQTIESKGVSYWLAKPLPNIRRLGDRLARAGKTISPKQYALRRLLWLLAIMFIVSFIFRKSPLLGFFLGIIFGVWLPLQFLKFSANKQSKVFLQLFPNAIDLIVRGLRSGLPVSESLVLVSHEIPNPVGSVFSNISNTMKLGVPMEKALQETAHKLDLTEFNFFTTSIILQRETGGNLAEILGNLSEVLRGRFLMRMKIKAMSSEARASAYIIGALPFIVISAVAAVSPDYLKPLYEDYRGNECAASAAFLMVFGMWVMRRMTQFEI
ncbi:MAG: type II secretion system F family protein [Pseudomonadota bacterium]|nr:type II secretion system F family protein [Pseudomonadota bacterium]MDE3037057.1 type II secretion system F family protein [Pseudomonadota bacterium]